MSMAEDEERRRRLELQQLMREIEMEELEVEEVDEADISPSSSPSNHQSSSIDFENGVADEYAGIIYEPCLVSMPSHHGEVADTHHSETFQDTSDVLRLPMFYIEGAVLFPEATLPLRVTKSEFRASVERALKQGDTPGIVGVVHIYKDPGNERLSFSTVGTTALIQQYSPSDYGSLNVLIHGKQQFHFRNCWTDTDGMPCADVQIIHESLPLRTPREAFGQLASITSSRNCVSSRQVPPDASHVEYFCTKDGNQSESTSESSFENCLSPSELQLHCSAVKFCKMYDKSHGSKSTNDSQFACESRKKSRRICSCDSGGLSEQSFGGYSRDDSAIGRKSNHTEGWKLWEDAPSKWLRRPPRSFWPHWVYRMYDSYYLAQRATVMWKHIIGVPCMDDLIQKPNLLSFRIASKIPASVFLRQQLLEIDSVSDRLRREIELLECLDSVSCKTCQSVITRRSEMLEMSGNGPLGDYANVNGYAHEVKAFYKANGLALKGSPSKEYSWFSGYAWTITTCSICETFMGWLFTATEKASDPKSFWAIRCSQINDNTYLNENHQC